MAIYEYKCSECKNVSTVIRSINDSDSDLKCNTCHVQLNRVYSSIGVAFSGKGFYSTDK